MAPVPKEMLVQDVFAGAWREASSVRYNVHVALYIWRLEASKEEEDLQGSVDGSASELRSSHPRFICGRRTTIIIDGF